MEDNNTEKNITSLLDLLASTPGFRERLVENAYEATQAVGISISLDTTKDFLNGSSESSVKNFVGGTDASVLSHWCLTVVLC